MRPVQRETFTAKLRTRKVPGNQAHVTNAKDDPVQMAADAATAAAMGFDEIETTMRVARNSWSNALACLVGASVGKPGTLFQCACEEAEELKLGMAGLTSYAETVSVYGTEGSFIDGDDTPWSKAFLIAAYISRGGVNFTWQRDSRTHTICRCRESRCSVPVPFHRHVVTKVVVHWAVLTRQALNRGGKTGSRECSLPRGAVC